jgi:predicted N-acetyltransferase YhbS
MVPQWEWDAIEAILAARGWMSLNRETTPAIVLAERNGMIVGFIALQMIPHTEPLYVAPDERGTEVASELSDLMLNFLRDNQARGWMVVAENPFAERLCRQRGMVKVEYPVYVALPQQGGF